MTVRPVVIAMNGVTGKMGHRHHLVASIMSIRADGGLPLPDGTSLLPEPVLVGRSESKLRALSDELGLERLSTSLPEVLADPEVSIYFDAQASGPRADAVRAALRAGKHVYVEKPMAMTLADAQALADQAAQAGVRTGVVHDKLGLPGIEKLLRVRDSGFFGDIVNIDVDFGWWIFDGDWQPSQRPSWNYRRADGGGMVADMFPHWRYLVEAIGGPIATVSATAATAVPRRFDETGAPYRVDVEDRANALLELASGATVTIRSSWCTRPYRDDLLEIHVDGTLGSAVVGTRSCKIQPRAATGTPVWRAPDFEPDALRRSWQEVPDNGVTDQPFKTGWERYLRHVYCGEPFDSTFAAGVRDLEFVEKVMEAAQSGVRQQMGAMRNTR